MNEAENIDKIRDILFGNNMHEYEKRFDALESRLQENLNELRNEFQSRMSSLENFVQEEFKSLSDQLKSEKEERGKAIKKLLAELESLDDQINTNKENTANSIRELRQQLLELSNSLNDQLNEQGKEIKGMIDMESRSLQTSKVERSSLALLFTDIAYKLSGGQPSAEMQQQPGSADVPENPAQPE